MPLSEISVEIQPVLDMRMPVSGDNNVGIAEKPQAADALREWLKHIDGEVQGTPSQLRIEIRPPGPDGNNLNHRCDFQHSAGQLGQELGLQDIAKADVEHPRSEEHTSELQSRE